MYDRILVPTDGSDPAEAAVEQAIELAKSADATIHALFVIELNASSPMQINLEDIINRLAVRGEEVTSNVQRLAESAGVEAVTSVRTGNADEEIVGYASDQDIDSIVMGTHGRRGIERYLLGSVTERVVRTSPVPVLTVRQTNDTD